MKTGIITQDQIRPGTAEAIASGHLSLFGSTNKIPLTKNLPDLIERVRKIAELLDWNREQIENLNKTLLDTSHLSYVNLFGKHEEVRNNLRFKYRVRERLINSFRKAVNQLTFVS